MNKAAQDKVDELIVALCDVALEGTGRKVVESDTILAIARLIEVSVPDKTSNANLIGFVTENNVDAEIVATSERIEKQRAEMENWKPRLLSRR